MSSSSSNNNDRPGVCVWSDVEEDEDGELLCRACWMQNGAANRMVASGDDLDQLKTCISEMSTWSGPGSGIAINVTHYNGERVVVPVLR